MSELGEDKESMCCGEGGGGKFSLQFKAGISGLGQPVGRVSEGTAGLSGTVPSLGNARHPQAGGSILGRRTFSVPAKITSSPLLPQCTSLPWSIHWDPSECCRTTRSLPVPRQGPPPRPSYSADEWKVTQTKPNSANTALIKEKLYPSLFQRRKLSWDPKETLRLGPESFINSPLFHHSVFKRKWGKINRIIVIFKEHRASSQNTFSPVPSHILLSRITMFRIKSKTIERYEDWWSFNFNSLHRPS